MASKVDPPGFKAKARAAKHPAKARSAPKAAHSLPLPLPSRQSLEEVPFRALRFLRAVSGSQDIARALASRGYGAAEHDAAMRLLVRAFPWSEPPPAEDNAGKEAYERATAWSRANVGVLRATLERRFPEAAERLFARLSPKAPDDRNMFFLLSALVALGKDPASKPVWALLEQRGIRVAEAAALLKDVTQLHPTSNRAAPPAESNPRESPDNAVAPDSDAALAELFRFLQEWSAIAHATIHRRDHLVRLGLAERRRKALPPAT